MARDILSEFNTEEPGEQKPRATNGGQQTPKDVMGYKAPYGPKGIDSPTTPGLHGNVYPSGTQSAGIQGGEKSGRPGIGGKNRKGGSQQ